MNSNIQLKPKLNIIILTTSNSNENNLIKILSNHSDIDKIKIVNDERNIFQLIKNEDFDAVFIDIFSKNLKDRIEIIENLRIDFEFAPICLIGDSSDLVNITNNTLIPKEWRRRFSHYFKLNTHQKESHLEIDTNAIIKGLKAYWYSSVARKQLNELRQILSTPGNLKKMDDGEVRKKITSLIDISEQAISSKTELNTKSSLIPFFNDKEVKELITKTIQRASNALENTSRINILIIFFGFFLIIFSFIMLILKENFGFISFGGFGIAGIISTLITSPLKEISKRARHLIQIQISYLNFIKTLSFLDKVDTVEIKESEVKCKILNDATKSIQEQLSQNL